MTCINCKTSTVDTASLHAPPVTHVSGKGQGKLQFIQFICYTHTHTDVSETSFMLLHALENVLPNKDTHTHKLEVVLDAPWWRHDPLHTHTHTLWWGCQNVKEP